MNVQNERVGSYLPPPSSVTDSQNHCLIKHVYAKLYSSLLRLNVFACVRPQLSVVALTTAGLANMQYALRVPTSRRVNP